MVIGYWLLVIGYWLLKMMDRIVPILKNNYLEQPRRGKTREALITPHKRSAVWGVSHPRSAVRGVSRGCGVARRAASLLVMVLLLAGCRMSVSLTGGTVDARAKTVAIATFPNNASLVNPTLSQSFTTALKDKIQAQTPLTIVNTNGDYAIEGEITDYTVNPVAIQGNDAPAMNRLTITVRVRFFNKFDEEQNFDQSFSRYADYYSSQNLSSVETSLVAEISDALTDDIFNKAFVNW